MTKRLIRQPRRNALSIRSILVLFLTTLTLSLIILSVLFNVVFKNIDMSFNTRIPESAPVVESTEPDEKTPANAEPNTSSARINTDTLASHSSSEPFMAKFIQQNVTQSKLWVPYAAAPKPAPAVTPPTPELTPISTAAPLPMLPTLSPEPAHQPSPTRANPPMNGDLPLTSPLPL